MITSNKLRELEKIKKITDNSSSHIEDDSNQTFRFISKGYSNQLQIIPPTSSDENNDSPNFTLCDVSTLPPFGITPLLNEDIKQTLEDKYLKPKPVLGHHVMEHAIQLIDKSSTTETLFVQDPPRNLSFFQMKRDPVTGKVLFNDYTEIFHDEQTVTAKNSILMNRDPNSFHDFVRGKSSNMPFLPGGLDLVPSAVSMLVNNNQQQDLSSSSEFLIDGDQGKEDFFGLSNLLTTPPGFDHGMTFGSDDSLNQTQEKIIPFDQSLEAFKMDDIMKDIDEIAKELLEAEVKSELQINQQEESAKEQTSIKHEKQKIEEDIDELLPKTIQALANTSSKIAKKPIKRDWAHMIDVNRPFPDFHELVPDMAFQYPFELDTFQKQAVFHLEKGDSVFVAAHTSAGKTVVAEYAIALAQKHMTRAIYTSPIKALSNQKFRDFKGTFQDVGILTGDVQINSEASCLIMTTEILRSMLYRGADLIRDVEFVIFDEVHYVNDADRGVVWEEVIIMLPAHVNLILLSATVPNTREFADWVGRTKKKDIYVISTPKRPVPLEHHLHADKEVYKIVDAQKNYLAAGWKQANDALTKSSLKEVKPSSKDSKNNTRGGHAGRGRGREGSNNQSFSGYKPPSTRSAQQTDRNTFVHLVGLLRKKNLLPTIVFSFSKRKCDEYANGLSNIDLTSGASENSEIHIFCEKSLQRLKGTDRDLPQVLRMRELLGRGIGVHHAGLLPIIKEMVEVLFTKGLIKILFATETFAMGVNAPAKAVVFSKLKKHDGTQLRELLPGEYTQMSGRAGRRGLDDTGMVIILCDDEAPEPTTLTHMILGNPTKLESQFRLTYNMILSLLRVEALKIEDMIKRSFSENMTQKLLPEQEKKLREISNKLDSLQNLECVVCVPNIYDYYDACIRYLTLTFELRSKLLTSSLGTKSLSIGRVVMVNNTYYRNVLGIIIQSGSSALSKTSYMNKEDTTKTYQILVLYDKTQVNATQTDSSVPLPPTRINIPTRENIMGSVVTIPVTDILLIVSSTIKFQSFKDEETSILSQLFDLGLKMNVTQDLTEQDWSKMRELEFQEKYQERNSLLYYMKSFQCNQCPDFDDHYGQIYLEQQLQKQISELSHLISDQNLELLPEYHQRVEVLRELNFIDENSTVTLKGRVACEINTADELIMTELVLDNFFANFDAAETVALLSCFIFQEKSKSEPTLTPHLTEGVEFIKATCVRLAEVQKKYGVDVTPESILEKLKFGLVEVVYEWSKGMSFKQITNLTDVPEGSIVRSIVRLEESCRELKGAARLMGDPNLFRKMEEAQQSIKRDIVFAASLYF